MDFSTRRLDRTLISGMDGEFALVKAGDLILAQVESLGQHKRVQLPSGRPSNIYPGDMVVMACGARYAPAQFEGLAEIDPTGADLLAGGGCIAGWWPASNASRLQRGFCLWVGYWMLRECR